MKTNWLQWGGAKLEGAGWQGIERVELDSTGTVLKVKLHQPARGLSGGSLEVVGGRLGRGLPFQVLQLSDSSNVVTLQLERVGDYYPYQVRLRDGGSLALHPFFTTSEFSFAVGLEGRDCEPEPGQAEPVRAQRPTVDLLTKDFTGFVQLLADRVRVTNPHWADLSPASLERVLLELLSHHADLLSYYQDRVAAEAFVEQASQRHSLRQHGLLLGYRLFDGLAAETVMAFESTRDGVLPAGLSVRMRAAADEARVVFHLPERTRVVAAHGRLPLAAWPGAFDAEVPEGATEVLLWGHIENLLPGQRLAFRQGASAQVVELSSVRHLQLPGWTARPEQPAPATPPALTAVAFQPPLRTGVRPFAGDFVLLGNLARARHGEAQVAHYRPVRGRSLPRSHIILREDRQSVVRQRSEEGRLLLRALRVPGPVLFSRGGDGTPEPLLELLVAGRRWTRVEHLHGSQSFHLHYVATADEDGSVWLQFGDGVQGAAIQDAVASLEVRYRKGEPMAGNCAPDTLTELLPPEDAAERAMVDAVGLVRLTNVTPGTGGRQPESRDAARLSIPASLRHGPLERAVSLEDYATVARSVPGVARAAARHLGGVFNTVLVLVDPEGQADASPALLEAVRARLEQARLAGREVRVSGPRYVPIELHVVVSARPGSQPHEIREAVYAALRPGTARRPGFFHPDRLTFGDDVELGDVLAHVQRVPGVREARVLILRRLYGSRSELVLPRIALAPQEVARLDADEDFPENGVLRVRVVGLDASPLEVSP